MGKIIALVLVSSQLSCAQLAGLDSARLAPKEANSQGGTAASGGAADGGNAGTSSSGGSAGAAASGGASADGGGTAGSGGSDAGACPTGRGPSMIRIDAGGKTFCIDSTEVTRKQYVAFLNTGPSTANQQPICAWNTTFTPPLGTVDLSDDNAPIVKVDWCDAAAFCAWAGKRLCGAIDGGGALSVANATDPTKSEWMAACSRNGSRPFPYGQVAQAGYCNTNSSGPAHVGSFPNCQGGYDGIFDMVGNVAEWTNECDGLTPQGAGRCADRGGTYATGDSTQCSYASPDSVTITASDWGIRCCAD